MATSLSQSLKCIYSSNVNVFSFLSLAIKLLAPSVHRLTGSHGGEELEAGNAHFSLTYQNGKKIIGAPLPKNLCLEPFCLAAHSIDCGKVCLAEGRAFMALWGTSKKRNTQPLLQVCSDGGRHRGSWLDAGGGEPFSHSPEKLKKSLLFHSDNSLQGSDSEKVDKGDPDCPNASPRPLFP